MKGFLVHMVGGMRTGALFYLLVFLTAHIWSGLIYPPFTVSNILAILVMSGLIGGLTVLVDELDPFPHVVVIGIHFLATALVVYVTSLVLGWGNLLTTPFIWLSFLVIYALVWLYQVQVQHQQTKRINQALKERRDNVRNNGE